MAIGVVTSRLSLLLFARLVDRYPRKSAALVRIVRPRACACLRCAHHGRLETEEKCLGFLDLHVASDSVYRAPFRQALIDVVLCCRHDLCIPQRLKVDHIYLFKKHPGGRLFIE